MASESRELLMINADALIRDEGVENGSG